MPVGRGVHMPDFAGAISLPIERLHLEITNICNFSCEFCPEAAMNRPRGMMPTEFAQDVLNDASRSGAVRTIHFHVMGEPTLHPDLVDIVAHATGQGLKTCLTTNGSRLDEALLRELNRAGLNSMIISLQTPDEQTFRLRGSKGVTFQDYAERIVSACRLFLAGMGSTSLTVSFLSSPLRRLIIPVFPEVSIADTSADLKRYLQEWADRVMAGTPLESKRADIVQQIRKTGSFRENVIQLTDRISFRSRIMGDWAVHFNQDNVNAHFGFCPGIRENFGILWNGDYTFCCTDYEGKTCAGNFRDMPLLAYLTSDAVQQVVRGFDRFRVLHPYCRQCLGDRTLLNTVVRQIGSVVYFKMLRNSS